MDSPVPHLLETNRLPSPQDAVAIRQLLSANEPELARLNEAIASAQLALSKLLLERDQVSSVVHSHRRLLSPVLDLPPELLSLIFEQCLPTLPTFPSGREAPLLLSSVCQRWREIAVNTPVLWSRVNVNITTINPRIRDQDRILRAWLERSQECSLHILIISSISIGPTRGPIMKALVANIGRWKSFSLESTAHSTQSQHNISASIRHPLPPPSPFLESVKVVMQAADPPFLEWIHHLMTNSTTLRRVEWNRNPRTLPLEQLTHLRLIGRDAVLFTVAECVAILMRANRLIECDLTLTLMVPGLHGREVHQPRIAAPSGSISILAHSQLTNLVLYSKSNIDLLFDLLTLPALKLLRLDLHRTWPHAQLCSLLTRSACSLEHFELNSVPITDTQLLQCLQHKSVSGSLRTVRIYHCRKAVSSSVLQYLTPTDVTSAIPTLRHITIDGSIAALDGLVSQMVEARRRWYSSSFEVITFAVTLPRNYPNDWKILDELQGNRASPLRIKVYGEDSDYWEDHVRGDVFDSDSD